MRKAVAVIGYGSIGKRHTRNLIALGIRPYILTKYPDKLNAQFVNDFKELAKRDIQYCIIATPTARHLADFIQCKRNLAGLKKVLIEKPLESSSVKAKRIEGIARQNKLKVFVAYNLRFIKAFAIIKKFIKKQKNKIKIVEVVAGQNLQQWRPYKDVRGSYSASRKQGGGVDLDLSHEIDYALWLFKDKFIGKIMYRDKISNLKINSPDIFKLILNYPKFIIDITLDYIRRTKERYLKIICDNGRDLFYDFITGRLEIEGKTVLKDNEMDKSYMRLLESFLDIDKSSRGKLCSLKEAINVLEILEV